MAFNKKNPPPPEYRRAEDGLHARQGTAGADSPKKKGHSAHTAASAPSRKCWKTPPGNRTRTAWQRSWPSCKRSSGRTPRRTGIQALHGRDQELRPDGFLHAPRKWQTPSWEAIWDTRIAPKRILDPSAGTGFSSMPWISTTLRGDHLLRERPRHGVDPEAPAPRKQVRVQGFERIEPKYAGYYDVAVSNIPFGDVALFDPFFSIHTDPCGGKAHGRCTTIFS